MVQKNLTQYITDYIPTLLLMCVNLLPGSNVQYQIKAPKRTQLTDSVSSLLLLTYYHSNEPHFTSTLKKLAHLFPIKAQVLNYLVIYKLQYISNFTQNDLMR
jgi:hypothetical protein